MDFYPRPPRGGRPSRPSTTPASSRNFYPRPPRGGRRRAVLRQRYSLCISIHALREEGDRGTSINAATNTLFLSTPSARRATCSGATLSTGPSNFYPRPPRGGRHEEILPRDYPGGFLSTPSARRATVQHGQNLADVVISIHALREEGDDYRLIRLAKFDEFLSTPSARRATYRLVRLAKFDEFLSTPSARRATRYEVSRAWRDDISIHALREEGDASTPSGAQGTIDFYPRPPRGGRPTTEIHMS